MFRALIYALLAIFVITVVRMLARVVLKGIGDVLNPAQTNQTARTGSSSEMPAGGELKRDPVCGTFVPAGTSLSKTVQGETSYFCSAACRDKFTG